MASEKLYESFCHKTFFKKTARRYNSRYFCVFKKIFRKTCHDHAGFVLCLLSFYSFFSAKRCFRTPRPPKSFRKFFFNVHDLNVAAFLTRFTEILESIKDFLKKQASKLLSCRGGLGEAPYNKYKYIYIYM